MGGSEEALISPTREAAPIPSPVSPVPDEGEQDAPPTRINMIPFPPPISRCRVKRVAFTGGPCGGQTTALSQVAERLRSMGIQVFVCPEAASIMQTAGVSIKVCGTNTELQNTWTVNKLQVQMTTESALIRVAEASERTCVVLFDRGCMDSAAYCTPESWQCVLDELKLQEKDLFDRYDAVFHLTTTAKGAESFYEPGSQTTQLDATKLDDRLQDVWRDHPQFTVIDNGRGGMEEKTQHAVSGVCHFLGVHSPMLCKQQYLVDTKLVAKMNEKKMREDLKGYLDEFLVEITFLEGSTPDSNTFLRHRLRRNTDEAFAEADSYVKCVREIFPLTPGSIVWPSAVTPPGLVGLDGSLEMVVTPTSDVDSAANLFPTADEEKAPQEREKEKQEKLSTPPRPQNRRTKLVSTECLITQQEYQHLSSAQAMSSSRTLVVCLKW